MRFEVLKDLKFKVILRVGPFRELKGARGHFEVQGCTAPLACALGKGQFHGVANKNLHK